MKKTILFAFASMLVLPMMAFSVVAAHDGEDHSDKTANDTTKTTPKEDSEKSRSQRIADRKAKMQAKLTQMQEARLKGRCQAIASIVKNTQTRVAAFEEKRPGLYNKLAERLEALAQKLEAAEVDTTTYNQQLTELKQKVAAFDDQVASLKQAADDLAAVDCAADTEGFVATVKEVVALRRSVIKTGGEIRTYLRDTLRPTLIQIQDELSTKDNEG